MIAQHSSSLPDGTYGGTANGFVFDTPDGNFNYSGDTALTLDLQLIPRVIQPDFAVFPIGDGLTMGVAEAIEAAKMVKCDSGHGRTLRHFPVHQNRPSECHRRFQGGGNHLILTRHW